jgi:hypothetical protein
MQLTTREARKIMEHLGFEISPLCNHHHRGWLVIDGRAILAVHCSLGNKPMPGHIPDLFRKSLHLERDEFERLRRRDMDRVQYIQLLRDKGVVG